MASQNRSSRLSDEIKEVVAYRLDDVASSACDDEKTADGQEAFTQESWNNPPVNKYRLCSSFILFLSGGLLFSSYGVSQSLSIILISQSSQVHEAKTTPRS